MTTSINALKALCYCTVIFCVMSCSSKYDIGNDTPEALGKTIIRALRQNDETLFQKFIYTQYEVDYIAAHFPNKKRDNERRQERYDGYKTKLLKAFEKIKRDATTKGLNEWSDVEFSKMTFGFVMDDLGAHNTRLEFSNGEFFGSINLYTLHKSDRGWFMVGMSKFGRYYHISDAPRR